MWDVERHISTIFPWGMSFECVCICVCTSRASVLSRQTDIIIVTYCLVSSFMHIYVNKYVCMRMQKYGCVDGTLVNGTSQPHMFRGISTSKGESSMPRDSSTSGSSATTHQEVMPHPGIQRDSDEKGDGKGHTSYMLMHPVYEKEYVESIKPFHRQPKTFHDYTGYYGVQILRKTFDLITGYGNNMTADKWLTRFLFLETVAGVPGMVGAMLRHLRSLRTMRRDNGWIHTLLEEAENERMHLLTFMQMRNPGFFFRTSVIGTQGIFLSFYTLFYAISPRHCHAFVSYLEEEAVKTYTHAISDLDSGKVPEWKNMVAPDIACKYWRLEKGASMRDLLLAVRADEVSFLLFALLNIWEYV